MAEAGPVLARRARAARTRFPCPAGGQADLAPPASPLWEAGALPWEQRVGQMNKGTIVGGGIGWETQKL